MKLNKLFAVLTLVPSLSLAEDTPEIRIENPLADLNHVEQMICDLNDALWADHVEELRKLNQTDKSFTLDFNLINKKIEAAFTPAEKKFIEQAKVIREKLSNVTAQDLVKELSTGTSQARKIALAKLNKREMEIFVEAHKRSGLYYVRQEGQILTFENRDVIFTLGGPDDLRRYSYTITIDLSKETIVDNLNFKMNNDEWDKVDLNCHITKKSSIGSELAKKLSQQNANKDLPTEEVDAVVGEPTEQESVNIKE